MMLETRPRGKQGDWHQILVRTPSLNKVSLPGDWVIRYGASQEELLADLARILKETTGKNVVSQLETVDVYRSALTGTPTGRFAIGPATRAATRSGSAWPQSSDD
jgi:hypothetical protein